MFDFFLLSLCHRPESTSAGPFGESYLVLEVADFVAPGAVCDCRTGIFDISGLTALLDPFLWLVRFYELHVPPMPSRSR